jgi:hypothetical protein
MTSTYACFLFSSSWTICFFTAATTYCQMYISPGLTAVSPAFAFGYPGTCRVGRLSALIAFVMSAPPLYSLCMWLAMASTVFLYLAAYFAFSMSNVWPSSPSTFVTNSFLIGPSALVDLRNFLAPSILGEACPTYSLFLFLSARLVMFRQRKPARLTMDEEVHRLLINNVDATY